MYKKAVEHFKKVDPHLHSVGSRIDIIDLILHPDPFIRLCRSIVGQQLSVKAASTIFGRFEKLFQKEINPIELLKFSDEKLREAGLSFQKIKYFRDLSQKTLDKELDIYNLHKKNNDEVIADLLKVKGIGQWTAEMFLMFSLAREDVFSFGDLGLQNAIMKLYGLQAKPTIEYMEKLSKKWSPYRTYAALILWRSLNNEPK